MLKKTYIANNIQKEKIVPPLKVVAWENNHLNYKQFSGKFNTIIKTIDQSFTIISLEGYDGWGKTFF